MSDVQFSFIDVPSNPFVKRYARTRLEQALDGLEWIDLATQVVLRRESRGLCVQCDVFAVTGDVVHAEGVGSDVWRAIDEAMEDLGRTAEARFGRSWIRSSRPPAPVVSLDEYRRRRVAAGTVGRVPCP